MTKPIPRTVRTAHLSVLMTVHSFSTQYNTEQFKQFQTNISARDLISYKPMLKLRAWATRPTYMAVILTRPQSSRPRPRPRPQKAIPRPRPRAETRPRPIKTKTKTNRDQDRGR